MTQKVQFLNSQLHGETDVCTWISNTANKATIGVSEGTKTSEPAETLPEVQRVNSADAVTDTPYWWEIPEVLPLISLRAKTNVLGLGEIRSLKTRQVSSK